jgi:hypothetical protein
VRVVGFSWLGFHRFLIVTSAAGEAGHGAFAPADIAVAHFDVLGVGGGFVVFVPSGGDFGNDVPAYSCSFCDGALAEVTT